VGQYADFQRLYEKYESKGLVVLGFPCNQFGKQEPGDEASIKKFAEETYGVTSPLFSKVDVKGPNAHPIFTFLKSDEQAGTKEIGWNFEKFLVDRRGKVAARYKTIVNPMKMESKIVELLNQSS